MPTRITRSGTCQLILEQCNLYDQGFPKLSYTMHGAWEHFSRHVVYET